MFWTVCAAAAVVALVVVVVQRLTANPSPPAVPPTKPGVVLVNLMPRTSFAPNASPFCVKLETWLRMAGVPYEVMRRHAFSTKGKNPWIAFDGRVVEDSALAIAHLQQHPALAATAGALDAHLTPAERAVAHAFRVMCDEELYWGLVYTRWTCNPRVDEYVREVGVPGPRWLRRALGLYIAWSGRRAAQGHGIGRHSVDDLFAICERDLQALNDQLAQGGGRAFLMGARACSADASAFAQLQALLDNPYPKTRLVTALDRYPALARYVQRCKDQFWPDWAEYLKPNGPKAFP